MLLGKSVKRKEKNNKSKMIKDMKENFMFLK